MTSSFHVARRVSVGPLLLLPWLWLLIDGWCKVCCALPPIERVGWMGVHAESAQVESDLPTVDGLAVVMTRAGRASDQLLGSAALTMLVRRGRFDCDSSGAGLRIGLGDVFYVDFERLWFDAIGSANPWAIFAPSVAMEAREAVTRWFWALRTSQGGK